jgi:hypothetical protein
LKDTWSIADQGSGNTPLALDEPDHRLFAVTRKPGKFLALDTNTGKIVFSIPTVNHADDLAFDERMKRIYIAGDGALDVFKQTDPDHYELTERIPTSFSTSNRVSGLRIGYILRCGPASRKAIRGDTPL